MDNRQVELKVWKYGGWQDLVFERWTNGEWWSGESGTTWSEYEGLNDIEIGAYTSWYEDPSTKVMVHFQVYQNSPLLCMYRKYGSEVWLSMSSFADKQYPLTDFYVKWYKFEELTPDTIYEVKLEGHKTVHRFKTMPATMTRPIKVAVMSDQVNAEYLFTQDAPSGFETLRKQNPDAFLLAGDEVHDDGTRASAWQLFWTHYFLSEKQLGMMTPFVVTIGNHDGRSGSLLVQNNVSDSEVVFQHIFFSNAQAPFYNTIDISDYLSIVVLNSDITQPVDGVQTTWLEQKLNERVGRHIMPLFHIPPYPGYYTYTWGPALRIRNNWTPLFSRYGVKVVANGHEHVAMVSKRVSLESLDPNGPIYVGQGFGMGNGTRGASVTTDTWYVDYINTTTKSFPIIEFLQDGQVSIKQVSMIGNNELYSKTI